ncbi:MAG: hypothetical protein Q9190_007964 [Brigantiaea leucoxantha]
MEIDSDLPSPANSLPHHDPMDPPLDPHPKDRKQSIADEPIHTLTPKPPVKDEDARDVVRSQPEDRAQEPIAHNELVRVALQPSVPYLQQNLMALFNLQPLAASVARTDPVTGEKINKMRKSYEGKVKAFGLAGRNRAVKHDSGKSMGLLQMVQCSEEDWQNHQSSRGRDVQAQLPTETVAKLEKAMQMQPGAVPNTSEYDWDDLLGAEKTKPLPTTDERSKKAGQVEVTKSKINGQVNGVRVPATTLAGAELSRPKRSGKKRRYDEDSFEGYGEGFNDDVEDRHNQDGGYSSGENSRTGGTSKKRKKVLSLTSDILSALRIETNLNSSQEYGPNNPMTLGDRRGSYGIGMIGIGTGVGAYGR